eukprot:CAMPEP_0196782080 /NCGR_PEP_ID=MMETSP1104-20130614/10646_1 /TAXON_ID=33652 /ORGANISM="Cafeteria sp., Strain Caron Lab Isolate" /LENGTH=118 /DNA_ID=CAMNT_0042152311 /DNA_START=56 /DNA_END=410 /DNA_ORIENTATION=-
MSSQQAPMTTEAAARIQSAECRSGDGTTHAGGFASRAQAAASRNSGGGSSGGGRAAAAAAGAAGAEGAAAGVVAAADDASRRRRRCQIERQLSVRDGPLGLGCPLCPPWRVCRVACRE